MKTLALAVLLLPLAAQAQQQPQCGDYVAIAKNLKDKFGESRIGVGLNGKGNAIAVFVSPDGATWTIMSIQPTGPACIVSEGRSWQTVTVPPPGNPT